MNFEYLLSVVRPGELAALTGKRGSRISQVRKMDKIPERLSLELEEALGLPCGWMQESHSKADWDKRIGDMATIPMADGSGSVELKSHRKDLLQLSPWGRLVAHIVPDTALVSVLNRGDLVLIDTGGELSTDTPVLVRADGHLQLRYAIRTDDGYRLVAAALQRRFYADMTFTDDRLTVIGPVVWRCGILHHSNSHQNLSGVKKM